MNTTALRRIVEVRPGEGRDAALAFLSLFTFMTAHGMLETARDALFLSRLPAARLPWVYFAMAGAGLAALWLARRAPRRSGGQAIGRRRRRRIGVCCA